MLLEQSQTEELQQLINEWLKQKNILAGAKVTVEIISNQVVVPDKNETISSSAGGFQTLSQTILVHQDYQPNWRGYSIGMKEFPHFQHPGQGPFLFTKPVIQEDGERLQRVGDPTAMVIRQILEINGITSVNLPPGYIVSVEKEESASWVHIDQRIFAVLKSAFSFQGELFVEYTRRKRGKQS